MPPPLTLLTVMLPPDPIAKAAPLGISTLLITMAPPLTAVVFVLSSTVMTAPELKLKSPPNTGSYSAVITFLSTTTAPSGYEAEAARPLLTFTHLFALPEPLAKALASVPAAVDAPLETVTLFTLLSAVKSLLPSLAT